MIRWSTAAEMSLLRHALFMADTSGTEVGERFLAAAEETAARLATKPGLGHPAKLAHPLLAGVRYVYVRGFPNHALFYRVAEGVIEILDVVHAARDLESYFQQPGD